MISLTWLHKKVPYLPDVSYQEYGQHMTIAPLNLPDLSAPLDDAGLLMCGPPHDFAVWPFTASTPAQERPVRWLFMHLWLSGRLQKGSY